VTNQSERCAMTSSATRVESRLAEPWKRAPLAGRWAFLLCLVQAIFLRPITAHRYLTKVEPHGEALFSQAVELGLEGIVAKRADSPYRAGRQPTWLKTKNPDYARQEALRFRSH
jgi:ATP-dependent DNA ligase